MKPGWLCASLLLAAPVAAQVKTQTSEKATPTPPTVVPSAASPAAAGDTSSPDIVIVVTPTRGARKLARSASSVTVITRRQIEQKKPFDITDLLRTVPSLVLQQSGTYGKQSGAALRGASSNQTLVLIDGVRVASPSFGGFDFGPVPVENIERIEVLRGPQSALYGSDAMGGVINIITRRGSGPMKTGAAFEYGNRHTNRETISANGAAGRGSLSFAATRIATNGFFANDNYRNLGASLRYDQAVSAHGTLTFSGRVSDANIGSPAQQFVAPDPNARSRPRDLFASIGFNNDSGRRHDSATLGFYNRHLSYDDPLNPGGNAFADSAVGDSVTSLQAQSSLTAGKQVVTLGTELHHDQAHYHLVSGSAFGPFNADFAHSANTAAVFIQDELTAGRWSLVPGLRFENNSQYGNSTNGRLAASYALNAASKLKFSLGTAFRAPDFDELYFPNFSNPNLKPEKSTGFDAGYERALPRGGRFEAMAFVNQFRDLIGAGPAFLPANIARARTRGCEFALDQPFGGGWRAILSQSFLTTSSTTGALLRRPRSKTAAELLYRRSGNELDFGLVMQGHRLDNDFVNDPPGGRIYGGCTRVDLTAAHDLRPGVQVYLRAQNLLNRQYEEVAGYPAPRLNFVVGLQMREF